MIDVTVSEHKPISTGINQKNLTHIGWSSIKNSVYVLRRKRWSILIAIEKKSEVV